MNSTLGYLAFALGPVQSFIATARTVRDLWTGSAILSWLTFEAMTPLLDRFPNTSTERLLVFPSLKHTPLLATRREGRHVPPQERRLEDFSPDERRVLGLPNHFLACIPAEDGVNGHDLAEACKQEALKAWRRLAECVRTEIDRHLAPHHEHWSKRWAEQIDSFFEVRSYFLPLTDCSPQSLERLLGPVASAGRVDERLFVDLAGRLLETKRAIRHVPQVSTSIPSPPKCSAMGTYEQMGPAGLAESAEFWKGVTRRDENGAPTWTVDGVTLRQRERLGAVALTKRFAAPVLFQSLLRLDTHELRFPDTATVAAAVWLEKAGINPDEVRKEEGVWSGQWLHWPRRDFGDEQFPSEALFSRITQARRNQGQAPVYYAILAFDGDHMGKWMRGELPAHGAKLPPGEISERLGRFAAMDVPGIVKDHFGTLVYSGGDDVLALLPAQQAISCAKELRKAFSRFHSEATASAGVAVAHYKEDLREALETARRAERRAKDFGRDALQLTVCPRSGADMTALLPWEMVPTVQQWIEAFRDDEASDRWAYRLRADVPTLKGLAREAVMAEIRRQVNRAESRTRQALADENGNAGEAMEQAFAKYAGLLDKRRFPPEEGEHERSGRILEGFLTLCQAASFVVRGRGDR